MSCMLTASLGMLCMLTASLRLCRACLLLLWEHVVHAYCFTEGMSGMLSASLGACRACLLLHCWHVVHALLPSRQKWVAGNWIQFKIIFINFYCCFHWTVNKVIRLQIYIIYARWSFVTIFTSICYKAIHYNFNCAIIIPFLICSGHYSCAIYDIIYTLNKKHVSWTITL